MVCSLLLLLLLYASASLFAMHACPDGAVLSGQGNAATAGGRGAAAGCMLVHVSARLAGCRVDITSCLMAHQHGECTVAFARALCARDCSVASEWQCALCVHMLCRRTVRVCQVCLCTFHSLVRACATCQAAKHTGASRRIHAGVCLVAFVCV